MVGTGKYRDFGVMRDALVASGAEIVTVSIRRVEIGAPGHVGILDAIDLESAYQLPAEHGRLQDDGRGGAGSQARAGDERTRLGQARSDP